MRSRIRRLTVTDFRSYREASLDADGQACFLFGPNGAGKTNLLEAISLFSPGRGLRGAATGDIGRRLVGDTEGRAWAVTVEVETGDRRVRLGTGVESTGATRRQARADGDPAPIAAMATFIRPIWLAPAHDRLFVGGASDRRRFLDRLVYSAVPAHAGEVAAYERALRERTRVLAGTADAGWLTALEAQAARAGARVAAARAQAVGALGDEIAARVGGPFPTATLELNGEWELLAADGIPVEAIEARLLDALAQARARDNAAGRALVGPHRTDLAVKREDGQRADQCSTGEQKALILNLILAQAARLSRAISEPNPVLLLDEAVAHLDAPRRAALFDELEALSLQAFLTGVDEALFETFKGRALGVRVDDSSLTVLEH